MLYSIIPTDVILAATPYRGQTHCTYARRGQAVVEMIQSPRGRCVQRIYSTNPADYLDARNDPGAVCRLPSQCFFLK